MPVSPGNPRGRWRVWDLDAELRYSCVVAALPASDLPICEIGSGPAGLATWTTRRVLGVDPGADDRHGTVEARPNFHRLEGDGAKIPLPDRAVSCAVAVDTFEHIPPHARRAVVDEMKRITADGGRVIIVGPTGADAATGDRYVLDRFLAERPDDRAVTWLSEHFENGLPTTQELARHLGQDRIARITIRGTYNLRLWRIMYRALLGDFSGYKGECHVHHVIWAPFGWLARRLHRGPYYRHIVVAQLRG